MEAPQEVGVQDFLQLMEDYLVERIGVISYRQGIFELMKKRGKFTEEEFWTLQTAFTDGDDYDAEVRLEHTILEPELKCRVAKSVERLAALGSSK